MLRLNKQWRFILIMVCGSHAVWAQADSNHAAETALSQEAIGCSAYYEISSEALAAMNAPQMQAVAERLQRSKVETQALAQQYSPSVDVVAAIQDEKKRQLASLSDAKNLGALMEQYKTACQRLLADPKQRLTYWTMATL